MRPRPTEYKTGGGGGRRADDLSEDGLCTQKLDFRGTTPVILNEATTNCFGEDHCTLNKNSGSKEELVASVWQSPLPDPPTMSAKIYLLSTTTPPKTKATSITDEQALFGCGVSEAMEQSIPQPGLQVRGQDTPTYSTFSGKLGSLLRVDFQSAEPEVGVNLELVIDDSKFPVWRRRGGCYDYFAKHPDYGDINVTLCLRGKVGLYEFDAENQLWEKDGQKIAFFYPWEEGIDFWQVDSDGSGSIDLEELMTTVHPFSNTPREVEALSDIFERADEDGHDDIDEGEYEVLLVHVDPNKVLKSKVFTTNVTSNSTWAALATSPCSDYEGTGVPGGEKAAILPWVDYGEAAIITFDGKEVKESKAKIVMGDGVFSRKPGLALTSRPAFKTRIGDVVASPAVGSMPTPTPMKLRSDWRQLCPEQDQTSCEGNVASLGWCADITFTLHGLMNARVFCAHPCMTTLHPCMTTVIQGCYSL
jgi:hypothetical protein